MNFSQACAFLNSFQFHGMKLGLERIQALMEALNNPHLLYPVVHVAGTNGKGSTAAMLARILQESGYRVGLYTSPHLVSVRERFLVSGQMISPEAFARIMTDLKRLVEAGYQVTYFELTTALAFVFFAEEGVDVAVIECGLGGTYDATNIVRPSLCLITNVGLDHQAYLGRTRREIAREKAGILKPRTPVITGARDVALKEIAYRASILDCPLYVAGRDFKAWGRKRLYFSFPEKDFRLESIVPGLKGKYQFRNASLALAAAVLLGEAGFEKISPETIKRGLESVFWPGRLEEISLPEGRVILDGAHNLDGVRALEREILARGLDRRFILLFGATDEGGDKPYLEMLRILGSRAKKVLITVPEGPRRPITVDTWRSLIREGLPFEVAALVEKPSSALKAARKLISEETPLLVAGSLYLVGKVRNELLSGLITS